MTEGLDLGTLFATHAVSLVAGVVGGYALQFLSGRQANRERKKLEDVATLERAVDIFNARVEYIIAYHTKTKAERAERQGAYHALYYGNLHALPESYVDPDVWGIWMRAERDARDGSRPMPERMKQIKDARLAVLSWLADRRMALTRE